MNFSVSWCRQLPSVIASAPKCRASRSRRRVMRMSVGVDTKTTRSITSLSSWPPESSIEPLSTQSAWGGNTSRMSDPCLPLAAPSHTEGMVGVHKSSSDLSKRTLHAAIAFVSVAGEAVSTLDHANAPLASGPPFLAIAENQRLLCSRLPVPLLVERLGIHTL